MKIKFSITLLIIISNSILSQLIYSQIQIETGSFSDDRDGQIYKTVKIGNQWWMAENLNYYTSSGSQYYNNDSLQYAEIYGRLYSWDTAVKSCPKGWHLSTHEDWQKLEMYLGISSEEYQPVGQHYYIGTNQGGMLKDTIRWGAPNVGAINLVGFSALPAGIRFGNAAPEQYKNTFGDLGMVAHFWASEVSLNEAYARILSKDKSSIHIIDADKTAYRSVRCVKDSVENGTSIDYFGQTPPGDSAVIFAPGIISLPERTEQIITFSPNGKECYVSVWVNNANKIYYFKYNNKTWSAQLEANHIPGFPFFSKDGTRLYFSKDDDIWMVGLTSGEYGIPKILPSPINTSSYEGECTVTVDGTVYLRSKRPGGFVTRGDIWRILPSSKEAENLGPDINTGSYICCPYISGDGSFLIFSSIRPGCIGAQDLYICFHKGNNEWTKPLNLEEGGRGINIENHSQNCPSISPDGKYLFFRRHDSQGKNHDIYWVSTKIIDDIRDEIFSNIHDSKKDMQIPGKIKLNQNYPNPFNPSTTIQYVLSEPSHAKLIIYNLLGQEIQMLQNGIQNAGDYSLTWDATDQKNTLVSSGIYFYSLQTNNRTLKKKMILIQ